MALLSNVLIEPVFVATAKSFTRRVKTVFPHLHKDKNGVEDGVLVENITQVTEFSPAKRRSV